MFEITAIVVPNLGSIDLIWGTKSLKEVEANLDFSNNRLRFHTKTFRLSSSKTYKIKPGVSKEIELIGKIPALFRNNQMIILAGKTLVNLTPKPMLVRLKKGVKRSENIGTQ